ncbi:MAG TPA: DUF433 domain-containing protein [Solirubrobacteraceae bacterium]|jgi:uncharacterized protein (DUF433 family)|nr:DUF433 domain-containing protein [Solirubrobacteraceae bacterium]
MTRVATLARGAYTADRAAALSGVPLSTVRWWAKHDILVPSVSQSRVMLWSYADLMQLRIIHWLRQPKEGNDAHEIPATTMNIVRRARAKLAALDLELWTEEGGPSVRVDHAGEVWLTTDPSLERIADGQRALGGRTDESTMLEVLAPFNTTTARGPDLICPRPRLRMVPGKLGGSPHIEHTRIESQAVAALTVSGLPSAKIYRLYPDIEQPAIDEAIDLERQLAGNLGRELRAA